jgi:hypothetical protein
MRIKQSAALTVAFLLSILGLQAQTGVVQGRVFDPINNEGIAFANVVIQGTSTGTTTDIDGYYELTGLEPGLVNVQASFIGYETKTVYEIPLTNSKPVVVDFELNPTVKEVEEVTVKASPFSKTKETPTSLYTIGVNEIQRYPGGNRDISRVIQSLPGVGTTVAFRNDILIRGGSPAENAFFVDGIEVPTINHFSTQGATGGPVGLINVDLIREVDFYSSGFPVNRGNALSSVMDLKLRDGRQDRFGLMFTVGASETALTFETPTGKNGSLIFSVRRSYLQLLFKLFELPFLPTYNDAQIKQKFKFGSKHELTFLAMGAYDNIDLNTGANETDDQVYILNTIPEQLQWNYVVGLRYRYFAENSVWTFVASRNHLNNEIKKYVNNDDSSENNLQYNFSSQEAENKVRIENDRRVGDYRLNFGLNYEFSQYKNFSDVLQNDGSRLIYNSNLNFHKYGLFGNVSRSFLDNRLSLSLGLRLDGNSYNSQMANPLSQISPRFALSYSFAPAWSFNFNTAWYHEVPPYTTLGYQDNTGELVNQDRLDYISCYHLVAGFEHFTAWNAKIGVEGFFKLYDNYPFLITDSISLANLGGDFGVIGDEPAISNSTGRSYGFEFLYQQKLWKGFYGIVSYTLFWSEFENKLSGYSPSAWDSRHIISLTGGKKFNKNWEVGLRWAIAGGNPYTPLDSAYSSIKEVWDANQQGLPDYDQLNSQRLPWFHQLDVRIDKKWFFKNWSINLYLDIQNLYNFEASLPDRLSVERDANNQPIENPTDPSRYNTFILPNQSGQTLPSIGLIVTY